MFFIVLLVVYINAFNPSEIRSPKHDALWCGRVNVKESSICDPNNYLTGKEKDSLEVYLQMINVAEIIIVLIPAISNEYNSKFQVETVGSNFAKELYNLWGLIRL